MNKNFTVSTQGTTDIFYEDSSCKIKVVAADFRDSAWYVGIHAVICKNCSEKYKLNLGQKYLLYQRISSELCQELFTKEFKFVNCAKSDLTQEQQTVSILEMDE